MKEDRKYRVSVLTISDKGAAGLREDLSGRMICDMLPGEQYEVVRWEILPDEKEEIKEMLLEACGDSDLILTTGGTGFTKRDVTPEATLEVAERLAPGISEYMRMKSMEITPRGMLSRGVSVLRGNALIINLPGSPKAVRENLRFVLDTLPHGLDLLRGEAGECAQQ